MAIRPTFDLLDPRLVVENARKRARTSRALAFEAKFGSMKALNEVLSQRLSRIGPLSANASMRKLEQFAHPYGTGPGRTGPPKASRCEIA